MITPYLEYQSKLIIIKKRLKSSYILSKIILKF